MASQITEALTRASVNQDSGRSIVSISITAPDSDDEQHIAGAPERSKLLHEIPLTPRPPALVYRQNSPSTVSEVKQTDELSSKLIDDDYNRTYLPPSRSPTEEGEVFISLSSSAPIVSKPKLGEVCGRASTFGPDGTKKSRPQDVPKTGLPHYSRPGNDTNFPRRVLRSNRDLRRSITMLLAQANEIGLDGPHDYVSAEDLSALMTDRSIQETLAGGSKDLIGFVKNNKKLFAITLLAFKNRRDLLEALEHFRTYNLSDGSLPVENVLKNGMCTLYSQSLDSSDAGFEFASEDFDQSDSTDKCKHRVEEYVFHNQPWDFDEFSSFYDKQWSFLIPMFAKSVFEYHFHDRTILPFKNVVAANEGDEGHFSSVYRATMLADCQDAIQTEDETISVAIKELKQLTGPSYNVAGDWQNEKDALFVFNQLGDEHIVKGIGAFTKRGKYYLLMEWADGGNLQQFWENNPDPHLTMTAQQVIELLTQFRGLAYALNRMHHYRARQEKTKSCSVSINTPGENEDETSWRHGDLKPGNILRFKDPSNSSNWVGTLKIGDLGRVRQHLDKTGKRKIGTSELFSTWRYEAPESWTSLSSPRSRLYDIWSLGCVILDSVIWMLYGAKKLKEFEAVVREPGHGSPYWTYESSRVNRKKAKIRDNVSALMQDMLDFHPECKAPSALRDLICLVRDKLLVVKLSPDADKFTPKCRANSFTLVEELDEIIRKAKNCSSYLFKGSDVTGIRAPSLNKHLPKIDYLTPDRQLTPANFVTRRTPSPFAGRPDDEPTRKHDSYSHDFDDTWKQEEDNTFAEDVLRRPEIDYQSLTPVSQSMLCPKCRSLDFAAPSLKIKDKVEELRKSIQKGCKFCDMRLQVAEKFHSGETFEFSKDSSGLQLNINARGPPVLSLYRTPVALSSASYSPKLRASSSYKYELTNNIQDEGLEKGPNYIQIGFPTIPQAGNDTHIGLLNAWLEDCDTKHEKCRPIYPPIDYPTRLLDLGSKDSQTLRLIESLSLPESEKATFKYIALSHPWGDPKCHQHLCTTSANIRNYRVQIRDQLPATLADAVKITRSLGVRYLWVDCLCIIQGDDGDFAEEAERMETVFSSAYFVIAATSAEGMSSGFLNRTSRRQVNRQAGHDIVCLPHRSKTGKIESMIYVDAAFDDFEKDVRDGPLNQRGWVFQERALARRTIHFTNNQTYWECGEGIRCETLTKMKNNYESFLGDPNFPNYGLRHKKGGDIAFYEFLYEQYSTLSFTRPEDRPVAIGGLEQRLIGALKQKGRSGLGSFGIFDDYWGRGLLWQRSSDTPKMTRLTSRAGGGSPAPSWSWMGHTGGITFMKHNPHSVKWLPSEIVFPWSDQQGPRASTTSYRGDLGLRGFARGFRLPESGDSADRLDIVYEDKDLLVGRQLKCVVIGRMNLENRSMKQVRNYVLILAELKIPGRVHVYERVGAGFIHGSLIEFAADPLSVSID